MKFRLTNKPIRTLDPTFELIVTINEKVVHMDLRNKLMFDGSKITGILTFEQPGIWEKGYKICLNNETMFEGNFSMRAFVYKGDTVKMHINIDIHGILRPLVERVCQRKEQNLFGVHWS